MNKGKTHTKQNKKHHDINKKSLDISKSKIIECLIQFLNIKEIFILLNIHSKIKNVIINSSLFKKYIQLRKEFIVKNDDEKIILVNDNLRNINKKKTKIKYGVSYYLYNNDNNNETEKNNNKEIESINSKIDFNKINIQEFIANNLELLKKLIKKYNLNSYEKNAIFTGLIDAKYNEKESLKIKELSITNNMEDGLFYLSKVLIYIEGKLLISMNLSSNNFKLNHIKTLSHLIQNKFYNIENLNLSNNKIDDLSCKYLFNSLLNCPNLKTLNLSFNQISKNGLNYAEKYLLTYINLINLNLSNNLLGIQGIAFLIQCLINNKNSKLKILDISFNGMEKKGILPLCNYFKSNNNLTSLFIGGNYICNEGLKSLIDFLIKKSKSKIEILSFENNNISKEGGNYISDLICNYNSINTIDLKNNNLSDEGVIFSLSNNKSKIISIDFSENNLGENSLKSLKEFISKNNSLKQIILDNNNFKEYVELIKDLLTTKSNLQKISLKNCKIGEKINLIFKGFQNNNKLIEINLSENEIGNYMKEFESIIPCLKNNKILIKINLDSNNLNDNHIKILSKAINDNRTLNYICLNNNNFTLKPFYDFYSKVLRNFKKCEFNNCGLRENELKEMKSKLEKKVNVNLGMSMSMSYHESNENEEMKSSQIK